MTSADLSVNRRIAAFTGSDFRLIRDFSILEPNGREG